MPDVSEQGFVTKDPTAYTSTIIGTAAGTTTISKGPCFFKGLLLTRFYSGASYIVYDSDGTSLSVVGTVVQGTSPTNNPPGLIEFDRIMNKLTVTNPADAGAVVVWR